MSCNSVLLSYVASSPFSGLDDDLEMSDISDPAFSCNADVACSGATSNYNCMHNQEISYLSDPLISCDADVAGSDGSLNHNSIHSALNVISSDENILYISSTQTLDAMDCSYFVK